MRAYLTYALNGKGSLVHIDDVPNGNECGCYCPHCNSELCAKNQGTGEKRIHHFAHKSGADCVGAVESALHKMAKDVIKEALRIQLPCRVGETFGELIKLDRVEIEANDKATNLRPDCIGYYGDKVIWIEFKRTHAVDVKKKGKIISAKIDCVELDINNCELDYDAVRRFITEESGHRIWIRDTKIPPKRKPKFRYDAYSDYECDYGYDWFIHRFFAKDENGTLVNLLDDEVDMNTHTYYCLACGKELTIDVNASGLYSFVHIEDGIHCDSNLYLHEAAKEIILRRFQTSKEFIICVPQALKCEKNTNCKFFKSKECSVINKFQYDLKKCGYTDCLKDYQLHDLELKCDLVIKNTNPKNHIIININTDGNNHIDTATKEYRVIDIKVLNETSLLKLLEDPIGETNASFNIKFNQNKKDTVPYTKINRNIHKFSLFSGGRYYFDLVPCSKIYDSKNTILEHLFVDFTDNSYNNDAKLYSIYRCYKEKRKLWLCPICFFLTYNSFSVICKRYKTKGTPHYPLNEKPILCQHFRIDKELENKAERLLKEWEDKVIVNEFK